MNTSSEFPTLETERLLLRPLTNVDLEFVFQHFSDPDVNRYLLDEEPITMREQAQDIIDFYALPEGKPYKRWVIVNKTDLRAMGTCGYHQWQKVHHRAEIGYDLEKASWKQGIMTEALQAMLQYGFEHMALNRIEALVYLENDASVRLLERLGFQKEGLLRQYFRRNDTYYDHLLLSLLKTERISK
jgi:ribosomal-protein-alanine N-acetyltransferase